ncbi:MAG: hypothetical protein U9Q62_06660 [Campylobacterota bacterium]|nr:hypothetical protein [Campylobacterota bacterium]
MNKRAWLQTVAALFLVMRVVLFERFEQVVLYGWWLLIATGALIFYWLDYRVAVGVVVFGFLASSSAQKAMHSLKPVLLRSGDRIEYVLPDAELQEQFQQAVLISAIAKEEVAKRGLFDTEQIDEYLRFYLISSGKRTMAIPYEWIMGIEINDLPLP